eukprot:COSAG02_NODE_2678_length_8262_cov_5.072400_6_plen_71_part_00
MQLSCPKERPGGPSEQFYQTELSKMRVQTHSGSTRPGIIWLRGDGYQPEGDTMHCFSRLVICGATVWFGP